MIPGDLSFLVKLKVAAGLAHFAAGNFELAAKSFTLSSTIEDLGTFCAPQDVALYASLVGLATLPREELQTILNAPLMELVPKMKECLGLFCLAEYQEAISILLELQPILALDMLLAPHLTTLIREIRNKAMMEYLKPFKRVSLPVMAATFSIEVSKLIKTLVTLIESGKIVDRRINCACQTLEKESTITNLSQTQEKIVALQDRVLNDSYACVIRLACIEFEQNMDRRRFQPHTGPAGLDNPEESSEDDELIQQVVANPDEYSFY